MEITSLLLKITEILKRLKISYAITGGMAVSVWGRPRYTHDIDIIIELLPKNLDALARELLKIDKSVYVSPEAMRDALEQKGEFNFIHPHSGLKVDFWVIKNTFNKKEIKRAVTKKIEGQKINFITPEDLVLSKLLWYQLSKSTRQLEDIESVFKISKVDLNYIKSWAKKQGTLEILNELLNKIEN